MLQKKGNKQSTNLNQLHLRWLYYKNMQSYPLRWPLVAMEQPKRAFFHTIDWSRIHIKQILAHEQEKTPQKVMNIIQDKHMNVILLSLSRDLNTTQDWQPAELTRWCISIANKYEMDEYNWNGGGC